MNTFLISFPIKRKLTMKNSFKDKLKKDLSKKQSSLANTQGKLSCLRVSLTKNLSLQKIKRHIKVHQGTVNGKTYQLEPNK